jgi:hypothetical protein
MTNYSFLEQNTLSGFSETAGILYMKLLDVFQGDERKAFWAANRYEDKCGNVIGYILDNMPKAPDSKTRHQISQFFSERYRHNFLAEQK